MKARLLPLDGKYCLGWRIEKCLKPIPDRRHDYDFWRDDYDGENGLSGTAASFDDAVNQINEIEFERLFIRR